MRRSAGWSGAASIMLSSTVIAASALVIWNVRPIPLRATVCGARPNTDWPSSSIAPRSGLMNPVARLNTVVLPAPFGPMSAVIEPRATSNVAPSTARSPPKDLTRSRTAKMVSATEHHLLALAENALRPERHDEDQNQADDEKAQGGHFVSREWQVDEARTLEDEPEQYRPKGHTAVAAQPAQHEDGETDEREVGGVGAGVDERDVQRQQVAGDRADCRGK